MTADREALLERRRALQERLRQDAARAAQREAVAGVAADLEAAGVVHELIWPEESGDRGWAWIERRFPLATARVAWTDVPDAVCRSYRSDDERDRVFRDMLGERAPDGGEAVVIVWGNALRPSIRMPAAAAREHCTMLLDSDFDLWVYSPDGDWLVECYHENQHCTGRAPSA